MKKTILIVVGILILLAVAGVWLYLLLYGVPENQAEVFTNFGVDGQTDQIITPVDDPTPTIDTTSQIRSPEALRQLTVRPIAGATLIDSETVRYAEQGTGHIYNINLTTGTEERISETTFVRITNAIFSPNGNNVALVQEDPITQVVTVGELQFVVSGDKRMVTQDLPPNASDIAFSENSQQVRFTISDTRGTRGYQQALLTNERALLFTIPLMDIRMIWDTDDDFFVYNKPSAVLEGFLYNVRNSALLRAARGGFGLTTEISEEYIVRSRVSDNELVIDAVNRDGGQTRTVPVEMLPEKCDFDPNDGTTMWCAAPLEAIRTTYPDDWYKGVFVQEDSLWKINIDGQEASLRSDFTAVSGRSIDATKLSTDGTRVLFVNRIDNTLWIFDDSR